MANCKFILTTDSGVLEFKNEAELDKYLEYKVLFSTTPFSKSNDLKYERERLVEQIKAITNQARLNKLDDSGNEIHEYKDSAGKSFTSVTEWIREKMKWVAPLNKDEYRKETELKVANELFGNNRITTNVELEVMLKNNPDFQQQLNDYYKQLFAEWDLAPKYGTALDELFNTAIDMFNSIDGGLKKKSDFIADVKKKIPDSNIATDVANKLWANIETVLKESKGKGQKVVLLSQQVLAIDDIAGSPDLLAVVLDRNNKPVRVDTYDLKMSFEAISQAKHDVKLSTYMYQTLTYSRMINKMLGLKEGKVMLLNHQMNVANKDQGTLNELNSISDVNPIDVRTQNGYSAIQRNIDNVLAPKEEAVKAQDFTPVIGNIEEFMESYFGFNPVNSDSNRTKSKEYLKNQGIQDDNNPDVRKYRMPDGNYKKVNITDDESFDKFVEEYNKAYQDKLSNLSNAVVRFIDVMRKDKDISSFEYDGMGDPFYAKSYLEKGLSKYIEDNNWEVLKLEGEIEKELSKMGIVLMLNEKQKKIDVIVASSYDLKKTHEPQEAKVKGTTIAGNFLGDSNVDGEGLSRMDYGTLEAIKGALYVYTQKQIFSGDIKVGRVVAVSGNSFPSISHYAFPLLQEVKKVRDLVNKKTNRLTTTIELDGIEELKDNTYNLVDDIITDLIHITKAGYLNDEFYGSVGKIFGKPEKANEISEELAAKFQVREKEQLIAYLEDLFARKASFNGKITGKAMQGNALYNATDVERLFGEIAIAINYLKNKPTQDKDLNKILMYAQNADAIESTVAKAAVDMVTDAIRNSNDGIRVFINQKTKRVRELKEELIKKHYPGGELASYVIGTHDYMIYNNMFELDENGKRTMYFKDPEDTSNNLLPLEREFLKEYLSLLNGIRQQKYSKAYPKLAKEFREDRRRQLEVPLNFATGYTALMEGGVVGFFKNKLRRFNNDLETFTKDDTATQIERGERIKTFDYFMYNDVHTNRQRQLEEVDPNQFEANLEYLLYDYEASRLRQKYYDKALQDVKILEYALAYQRLNTTSALPNTAKWMSDYVDRVLLGRKDYGSENQKLVDILNRIQGFASFGIIALNPFSGATAFMSNMFGIMSATISKNSVERDYFNMKDLSVAAAIMAKHFDNIVTNDNMIENLNRIYNLSNMDKYQLLHNMKDRRGIIKWASRMMYWFNSAPDYYWRMTMFLAQMHHDGVLNAHDDKGNYNYKKDSRFSAYVNKTAPETSEEYKKARALFDFTVRELKANNPEDGIRIEDGVQVPNIAYTRFQRNGVKKYADSLLGAYDEEYKGTWANIVFYRLFLQFKNFLISKKNIWIAGKHELELPQPKMVRGFFKEQEDGFRMFVPDPNGDDFIYENQGTYSEGMLVSLLHIMKTTRNNYIQSDLEGYKRFTEAAKQSREDFERWRLAGVVHGVSDLWSYILLLLLSSLIDEKLDKNSHWLSENLARSFRNAYKDLSPIEIAKAIGFSNTLPFPAVGYLIRLGEQTFDVATGDRELSQFLINSFGVTRNYSKLFNDVYSD